MGLPKILAALCAAAIGLSPLAAAAVTYQTGISFIPQGDPTNGQGPTSTDPADGNRVVLTFETDIVDGNINEDDLDFFSITLFGANGFIYQDIAIVDGMVTPLAGIERSIADIEFRFRTNRPPGRQLRFFDNDFNLIVEEGSEFADGVSYKIFYDNTQGGDSFIDVVRYDDGEIDLSRTVVADGRANFSESSFVVPLPASSLLLLSALIGGAVVARKNRA